MTLRNPSSYTPLHQEGNGDMPFRRIATGETLSGNFIHLKALNVDATMGDCVTSNDGDTIEDGDVITQGDVVSGQFSSVTVSDGLVLAYEKIEE